jgi:hypothetical protein
MFKKIFFLLLCFSLLIGQEDPDLKSNPIVHEVKKAEAEGYWKAHHSACIGYRRDRQKFNQTTSTSEYTNRNSLQLLIGSHLEWHRCVFNIRGSYGWLVNGNFHYRGERSYPSYSLGAGYAADVAAEVGYRLKWINEEAFGFSVIPLVGYNYSHLMNFTKGEKRPNTFFPNPNQQDWFGPFLEGRMEFRFWESSEWSFFYRYYWLDVRSKFTVAIDDVRANSIYKGTNIARQMGGTDLRYRFKSGFNIGLHFEGAKAWTDEAQYVSKEASGNVTQKIGSIEWVYYETDFSVGYQY